MRQLISRLNVNVSESHLGVALGFAMVTMALMLWAILWQGNLILYQRDLIRWMWTSKFGG